MSEKKKARKEKSNVIPIMLFVLGVLALGFGIYVFTYWEYEIVYNDIPYSEYFPVGIEKVYPLQWIGVIMACIGAILVVIGILKAKK